MCKATFTVNWPDGQSAIAEIEAISPETDYPVRYSGAANRLIDPPGETDLAFLAFVMRQSAAQTGGRYAQRFVGQYDRWAGGRDGL